MHILTLTKSLFRLPPNSPTTLKPAITMQFWTLLTTQSGQLLIRDVAIIISRQKQKPKITKPHTHLSTSHSQMGQAYARHTHANSGYVIPGMKNHSLISITKLCRAGCKVLFSPDERVVIHKGVEILRGRLHPKNGLWYLPINQKQTDTTFVIHNDSK
jgi:hypothetical protein